MANLKSTLRRVVRRVAGQPQPAPAPVAVAAPPASIWDQLDGDRTWQPRQPHEKVLFWSPGGLHLMLHLEGAIALGLRLRGAEVHLMVCDGPYRACMRREVGEGDLAAWLAECTPCKTRSFDDLNWLGLPHSGLSAYVTAEQQAAFWEQAGQYTWDTLPDLAAHGVVFGKNVQSSIVRYLKGVPLAGHEWIVREYAYSALVSAAATVAALEQHQPTRVVMSHGVYVDFGPALQIMRARGVPVTGWSGSYLKSRFFLRPMDDPRRKDFRRLSPAGWQARQAQPLTPIEEQRLDRFLDNRYHQAGSYDLKANLAYQGDRARLRAELNLPADKPVWGVLAHLNWDAVSDSSPMDYANFDDWMLFTLQQIERITNVTWLIKIHPSEIWHRTLGSVGQLIIEHYPTLPPHIRVLPADYPINPLDFMELIDGGVTVYGSAGQELALMGKPVIVAGEAHYAGKGFTYDGPTRAAYADQLRQAATFGPLTPAQQTLARQYAYSNLIQRQVPVPIVNDPGSPYWRFQPAQREQLRPGGDPFIDFICRQIFNGGEFIMDEALVQAAEGAW